MKRNVLLGWSLTLALGTAACNDQINGPTNGSEPTPQSISIQQFRLERGKIKPPPSVRMTDRYFVDDIGRAINPGDFVCSSTPLFDWINGKLEEWAAQEPEGFDILFNQLLADLVPTFDALLFETEDTRQFFGYTGKYTKVLRKTHRDTKRFWDISSDDIQLIGMHGTMLRDVERVAATYEAAFGVPAPFAEEFAAIVREEVLKSEVLRRGNHPILSFNAFALTDESGVIPDKIVIGDGILDGFKALGFDDVAPQAIYAHEFGHHIQFENGYFDDPIVTDPATDDAEDTRYIELMADAYSAYYLTHKRGQGMKRRRVEQFLQVFFELGDCAFSNPGHHGTPNQRMAAAQFGFNVAAQAEKKGRILKSDQFHDLFVAAYPQLIEPDANFAFAP